MKISELLDSIAKRDLVLPEFQREYVWSKEQAKQLFVSLLKEYPVGGLLFWKTDQPPELKNVSVLPEKLGMVQVILDGQQRLTTLFMLIRGEIPPYYKQGDITNDPRDLYFNLDNAELQYYQLLRMKANPLWVRVTDCYSSQMINVFEIAKKTAKSEDEAFRLAQLYTDHLTGIRNIEKDDFPTQTVPSHASMEDAIDIFDRANSLGTKLTDAELALTHVTSKWAHARRILKAKMDQLNKNHFYFDLTFMTRALTGIVCQRGLFETIHSQPKDKLEEGWGKENLILDYLVDILPNRAYIHSTNDLATTNALVPMVVYLSLNNNQFPNDTAINHAIHWLYLALTWARYTSQTDQRLEQDVSIVVKETNPWQFLCNGIVDQRGRIEVKADDLEGRGIQHPLYNLGFILSKAQGAKDWTNGSSLGVIAGKTPLLQNATLNPNVLYKNGFDSDNHLHRKIVSEIANRVVLKNPHPYQEKLPEEYFPLIEEKFPGTLVKHFIPMDPQLWKLSSYANFLAARRELIALKMNEFLRALVGEPIVVHKRPLAELIALGESATLEFKSTLQWDIIQNKQNTALRHEVLKTIAAFLNTDGGTLVIGVEDNGHLFGLEQDFKLVHGTEDGFQKLLSSLMIDKVGPEYSPYMRTRFEKLNSENVCVIDIDKATEPAYIKGSQGTEFFIRMASTSRKLDPEETVNYVKANW